MYSYCVLPEQPIDMQTIKDTTLSRNQCQMSLSKKIDLQRDFAAVVLFLSEATLPSCDSILYPPPLHTVYVYTVYLFTQRNGGGGGGEGQ